MTEIHAKARHWLSGAFAIGLLMGLFTASADAAIKLKVAGQHPAGHSVIRVLKQIKKDLEAAGVGLKLQLFVSDVWAPARRIFTDVQKGVIDIAHTFVYSHDDPLLEVNSLPYLLESYDQMRKTFTPGSNFYSVYSSLLAKQGVKLLGIFAEGFIGVGASRKPKNANVVGDKGITIRVWSAAVAREATRDIGFDTTTIDWADALRALRKGLVDGVIGGTPEANYLTFREAIRYFIPYNMFVENTAYYMNRKSWDKLGEAQKKAIAGTFGKAAIASFTRSKTRDEEFMAKLSKAGVEVIRLSDAERKAIADHVRAKTWPKFEGVFGGELLENLKADIR